MNLVLDYSQTVLIKSGSYSSEDYVLMNINMFKDEAIKYKIIQKT